MGVGYAGGLGRAYFMLIFGAKSGQNPF
nr:hypothetical protein [Helicobacter pylori]